MGSYSDYYRTNGRCGCGHSYTRSHNSGCGCSNVTPFGIIRAISRTGCCNRRVYGCREREVSNCGCSSYRNNTCGCGCDD